MLTEKVDHLEFGGPVGTFLIMAFSHVLPLYFWLSLNFHEGELFYPHSVDEVPSFFFDCWQKISTYAAPTLEACGIYGAFFVFQFVSAFYLPGVSVKGLPIPSENNRRLTYLCNSFSGWYVTLFLVFGLHYFDIFKITRVFELHGNLLTTSMIVGDVISLVVYLAAFHQKQTLRMSGNHVYDYFMGAWLNPRIGNVDLKLWAEIKMSWLTLFLLVISAASAQYEKLGFLSNGMIVILCAQYLYANACMKVFLFFEKVHSWIV